MEVEVLWFTCVGEGALFSGQKLGLLEVPQHPGQHYTTNCPPSYQIFKHPTHLNVGKIRAWNLTLFFIETGSIFVQIYYILNFAEMQLP